jgi:pimeloyl-ACP methyl ester carboxylesterase
VRRPESRIGRGSDSLPDVETKPPTRRLFLDLADVRLCCLDFGGTGSRALLLHGLAGRGSEWSKTAVWLRNYCHVRALDQRGHGRSDKELADFSRDAYVRDAIHVIEALGPPVVLIGQSMGGQNAFLVAARRPDLVSALVVADATPTPDATVQRDIREWLESWPVPFPTLHAAREWFQASTLDADAWSEVLAEQDDGYRPVFEIEAMVASVEDQATCDYWSEWSSIRVPTLTVAAGASCPSRR